MAQKRDYATKKKGKTKGYPFWEMKDIKAMIDYFRDNEMWNDYLKFMFLFLFGRRIGDTLDMVWGDIYYPNGNIKDEIRTIEEQKTGKYNIIYVSPYAKEVIKEYIQITGINPMNDLEDYIFPYDLKYKWRNEKHDEVYTETESVNYSYEKHHTEKGTILYTSEEASNYVNKWCQDYNKDYGEDKIKNIVDGWIKHKKEYPTLGSYLYNEVVFKAISKSQINAFGIIFNKAVKYNNISYKVTIHSVRRSFGYYSKVIHPHDMLCLETLQSIFGHANTQVTMSYIGLSEERERMYFNDIGEFLSGVSNGNYDIKRNSPVTTLKDPDLNRILLEALRTNCSQSNEADVLNEFLDKISEVKVD